MNSYFSFLNEIKNKNKLTVEAFDCIFEDLDPAQCSVLAYLISEHYNILEKDVQYILHKIYDKYSYIDYYLSQILIGAPLYVNDKENIDIKLVEILKLLSTKMVVGKDNFDYITKKIVSNDLNLEFIGLFLIIIYIKGLNNFDIIHFTHSIKDSGIIFDYKKSFENAKIIRRYPTGALSEKVALILPSMLSYIAKDYSIISPFTIAKSLSFTGGTWDKLSSIEGFVFPEPGQETINVLNKCSVAMSVTINDYCPADRILYKIRSYTGTVDSIDLAVASIASKQLACPADLLLLDVRYGEGAFFNEEDAIKLRNKINKILNACNIDVINSLMEMKQPNGSSVGNYLEICEAIYIIKNQIPPLFDVRAIEEQKNIVLNFFATLMDRSFSCYKSNKWKSIGNEAINNGSLVASFENILLAHGVSQENIRSLLDDPIRHFGLIPIATINSQANGFLTKIKQKSLGNLVNFGFDSCTKNNINILIKKRLGDYINANEPVCVVYSNDCELVINEVEYFQILQCFKIS